jgi:hypothetical protein
MSIVFLGLLSPRIDHVNIASATCNPNTNPQRGIIPVNLAISLRIETTAEKEAQNTDFEFNHTLISAEVGKTMRPPPDRSGASLL